MLLDHDAVQALAYMLAYTHPCQGLAQMSIIDSTSLPIKSTSLPQTPKVVAQCSCLCAAGTIRPNITDSNNGPFLLPTVTPEDAQKTFGINHRGFVVMGIDDTPGQKAYYIHLEAKPGKGDKVQQFLRDINSGVDQEPLTGPWFALRYSSTTFGIFEAFPNADARHTHDGGPGGRNFLQAGLLHDMLAYPAQLYRLDVLHGKFNGMFGQPIST